ncbi:nuclease domain-containing protein [Lysobacter koreensis]|uniref:Nuclease domain-containing protein n=1 Tax=Lysobacter koreensis TaxID=266122 RepID=A0ABW2YIM8_9GAMM
MSIVSKKLRESAGHPDAHCMLEIAGVCGDSTTDKTAGCVLCHIRLVGEVGGGQKPDDLCAAFGCGPCHTALDSNGTAHGLVRGSEDWLFYSLRGVARTLRWWIAHDFISIKGIK